MSSYLHCDHDGCGNHVRAGGILAHDWITINDGDGILAHACCIDHVMRWAARSDPIHEVPL